jgi:hypothetical protein
MIEFSADQTIEQVLLSGYYEVPRFQRPYSWTADNIGEFWTDIAQSEGRDYFIGAFIVYSSDADERTRRATEYAIVDGQQRLTTITVLLAAVRDVLVEVGEPELAKGVQSYIERADRRNQPRFILETEGGYPYLHAVIQSFPPSETPPDPMRSDEKLLQQAYAYFATELRRLRDSVLADSTIAREDRLAAFVRRLEDLRDRVLSLTVILVVVQDVDDAYIIFETLNTRGKDLSLADLVRNFLLRDLRESADTADMPRERFNRILERLQETGVEINPNDFLHHSWLSRREFTSKKNLFREIKTQIRTREQKAAYLREIEDDLSLYVKLRRPESVRWPREQVAIVRSLESLNTFHMSQPLPLVLAAQRAYERERNLRLRWLKRVLRAVEVFHFKFTAIAGKSSSGGISFRYAYHGRRFLNATEDDCRRNIDELIEKLREAMPSRDEFIAGFLSLGYSSTHTGDKSLAQYVLEQIYRHHMSGAVELNFGAMTIEHICPERQREGEPEVPPPAIQSIGNLILVSESLNNRLANRNFEAKRQVLANEAELWVDPIILEATEWGSEEIEARARKLAQDSYDVVWTL